MVKTWKFILMNVDTITAIAISIIATAIGMFGGNQSFLLAGISATLAILALGLIRDRSHREILGEQISELKRSLPDRPSALSFFRTRPDFLSNLQTASRIDLCGVTLTNTINMQFPIIRERLESGVNMRVLLIEPDSQAIEMSAQRSINPKDKEYYRRRLESSLSDLAYLYKLNEEMKIIRKRTRKAGTLAVRYLSYAPSFGMTSLNSDKKEAVMYVEIFPHKLGYKTAPKFELTASNDKKWHSYFLEQFDQMWDAAKPWEPKAILDKIPLGDQ
jgi:hypothetical protein